MASNLSDQPSKNPRTAPRHPKSIASCVPENTEALQTPLKQPGDTSKTPPWTETLDFALQNSIQNEFKRQQQWFLWGRLYSVVSCSVPCCPVLYSSLFIYSTGYEFPGAGGRSACASDISSRCHRATQTWHFYYFCVFVKRLPSCSFCNLKPWSPGGAFSRQETQ